MLRDFPRIKHWNTVFFNFLFKVSQFSFHFIATTYLVNELPLEHIHVGIQLYGTCVIDFVRYFYIRSVENNLRLWTVQDQVRPIPIHKHMRPHFARTIDIKSFQHYETETPSRYRSQICPLSTKKYGISLQHCVINSNLTAQQHFTYIHQGILCKWHGRCSRPLFGEVVICGSTKMVAHKTESNLNMRSVNALNYWFSNKFLYLNDYWRKIKLLQVYGYNNLILTDIFTSLVVHKFFMVWKF